MQRPVASSALVIASALVLSVLVAPLGAQVLYGVEGPGAQVWEFPASPGPPCPQPNAFILPCPFVVPAPCPNPPPPPMPFTGPPNDIHGDIAVDSQRDTYFVTDGFTIEEYQARGPCFTPPPCTPINAFKAPTFMGPINGLGMDELGVFAGGQRTLWMCDAFTIAGFVPSPPGTCLPPQLVFGPCNVITPGQLTDITWDPVQQCLWVCDAMGFVSRVVLLPPGGCQVVQTFPVVQCGLGVPLTGIAYDLGTPSLVTGGPGVLFVTDGFKVEAVDVNGAIAPPTFSTPVNCWPTPAPLSGLAYAANAITYGTPAVAATLTAAGQTASPGPTFMIEVSGSPPGITPWLLLSFNVPGNGYLCPPKKGVGTWFWVDPSFAIVVALPALPPGCVPIPIPVPGAAAAGLMGFMQIVYLTGGPPATDSTNGLAFTLGPP